jgi:phenol hydroxylase P2 protein
MSKVFLALQAIEESRAIIEAIVKDNPGVVVENQPAMTKVTAEGKLVIKAETVSDLIGREWDPQELQLVLITLAGNVDEDYDHFTIYWDN